MSDTQNKLAMDALAFTRQREKEIREAAKQAAKNPLNEIQQCKNCFRVFSVRETKCPYPDCSSNRVVHDPVNHPKHYNDHPSGVECITITRHMGFNIGNAIKYLWRAGRKDKDFEIQDLRKAIWYIEDEIKRLEADNG